jgi:hypothetical protein
VKSLSQIIKEQEFSPKITNLQLILENESLLEREGDEEKRKIANNFLELLKTNIQEASHSIVKTKTGHGVYIDYSNVLDQKFSILFYKFEDDNEDLGYWIEDSKMLYINILNYNEFINLIKTNNISKLFEIYNSTIFHELIHRFDHLRYSKSHKPADYGLYMNTYEEFNAFYQQYAHSIDKIVSKMKTQDEFYKRFGIGVRIFINEFWNSMNLEMKQEITSMQKWTNKWNKRLYQLYYEQLSKFQKNKRS